jgi:hypothetical protein
MHTFYRVDRFEKNRTARARPYAPLRDPTAKRQMCRRGISEKGHAVDGIVTQSMRFRRNGKEKRENEK